MADPNATGANTGLSDDAASGLAYLTFIPAIIFLVVAPFNTNPKVKFHAWQSIFLTAAWFVVWMSSRYSPLCRSSAGFCGRFIWWWCWRSSSSGSSPSSRHFRAGSLSFPSLVRWPRNRRAPNIRYRCTGWQALRVSGCGLFWFAACSRPGAAAMCFCACSSSISTMRARACGR